MACSLIFAMPLDKASKNFGNFSASVEISSSRDPAALNFCVPTHVKTISGFYVIISVDQSKPNCNTGNDGHMVKQRQKPVCSWSHYILCHFWGSPDAMFAEALFLHLTTSPFLFPLSPFPPSPLKVYLGLRTSCTLILRTFLS